MNPVTDRIKGTLLQINRLIYTMERLHLITITKEDLIKWRAPGFRQKILFDQAGNDRIAELIDGKEPLMISRLGMVEMWCLRFFLEKRADKRKSYSRRVKKTISNNAGFFPVDDDSLDAFSEMYLDHLKQADAMGVWLYKHEDFFCNNFCGGAELFDNACLEPFRFANPWSSRLAGKKVLVVHPFVESIRRQYEGKRELLFPSSDILPDFELKTVKAVQSIAGSAVGFPSWFDAYRHMCDEMAQVDFDICLIGAGAYGLPLASFAKSLGKQAIHLGGVTQILFGIKGRRWELEYAETTAKLFNEHWVRPSESEIPANKDKVERGCYW
jgi:hypothetical protein